MTILSLLLSISWIGVAAPPTPAVDTAGIASRIVQETVKYANTISNARRAPETLVDVNSFVKVFQTSTSVEVTELGILSATNKANTHRATRAEAEDCPAGTEKCRTLHEALFIQLTAVEIDNGTATANVTIMWTDHRPTGRTGIGRQDLRQEFAKVAGGWKLTKIVVTRTT